MRTKNFIFNFLTSIIPFAVFVLMGFVRVSVWQDKMGEDIYALNQLFFQLFAYLSIAEAGIGSIVQKRYYPLLIDDDKENICKYFTASKRFLKKICFLIFGMGFVLSFFLKFLAKDNSLSPLYMQGVFLLFLVKSLVEYFLFAPRFLLTADQKLYKINLQNYGYKILESLMEILLIYFGVSYLLVLIFSIVLRVVMNLHLNKIVYKQYPWLKDSPPDENTKLTGMSHILIFKIVSAVQENVGGLLISAFINPLSVIIYTNYKYITKYLNDFIYQVGIAINASLGNLLNQTGQEEKKFKIFETISSMFYFIASFLTLTLSFCINPFITLWVGENKLLSSLSLICLLFVFFHTIARMPVNLLKDIFVLYGDVQINSIIEAVTTTLLSLVFIKLGLGVTGVLLAAALSILIVSFFYLPIKIYKMVFGIFPIRDLLKYLLNIIIVIALQFVGHFLPFGVSSESFLMWFLTSVIMAVGIALPLFVIHFVLFKDFRMLTKMGLGSAKAILKGKKK